MGTKRLTLSQIIILAEDTVIDITTRYKASSTTLFLICFPILKEWKDNLACCEAYHNFYCKFSSEYSDLADRG